MAPPSAPAPASSNPSAPRFFLAVHGGAGWHDPAKEAAFLSGLKRSLEAGAAVFCREGGAEPSALDAACAATAALEDDEAFNAGLGSSLSEEGVVECDAAAVDRAGLCGAVAAAPGVRNPILLARELLLASRSGALSYGRVPPVLVVGDAARRLALSRGLEAAATAEEAARWLVTPAQRARWEKVRASVEAAGGAVRASPAGDWAGGTDRGGGAAAAAAATGTAGEPPAKRPREDGAAAGDAAGSSDLSDTVGAVCVCLLADGSLDCAAAVSSGGTLFKFAGRVGDAALPGCGCFARAAPGGDAAACTSVTGVGEHAIRAEMGGCCGRAMLAAASAQGAEAALAEAAREFAGPRDVGVLSLWARRLPADATAAAAAAGASVLVPLLEVEFAAPWAARSFAVGYCAGGGGGGGGDAAPASATQILRNEPAGLGGESVATFCTRCLL